MANQAPGAVGRTRPQYRNINVTQILSYRLPLAGIISILHRISGAAMFLIGIPFVLYLFDLSLSSDISWAQLTKIMNQWWLKIIVLGFIWSFCHHFFCGIRYLVLDMHIGLEKLQARQSAIAVLVCSLIATAFFGYKLFAGA
jgi:succinate dehydrogenase / fumarate reductase, cytochrome b subunit